MPTDISAHPQNEIANLHTVCGSYSGAIEWECWSDESPEDLAERLAISAGCEYYAVDGTTYGPF